MITEEQIKERVNYIGGSDAAAVLGLSRWNTPLRVWAEKTGQLPPREIDSEAVELGRELEDYVARRFTKKSGKEVRRVNETMFHLDYPFLGANIDRRIVGEKAILECKVVGAFKSREWEGESIPFEYICQCLHYLAVTGAERAYIACLIGNRDFVWKSIERDDKTLADLVGREVTFWNDFVIPKIMPTTFKANDKDTLSELFPEASEGKTVELTDKAQALLELLEGMNKDLSGLEKQIDETENSVRALMGDAEVGTVGPWTVKWANVKTRRFNLGLFKKDYSDLFESYRKLTTTRKFIYSMQDQQKEKSNGR